MKKNLFILISITFVAASCATVQVQAPKEAIKMDISMRLDVYQHVTKDIDDIESIVSGKKQTAWLNDLFVQTAYAEGLSPEVEQAAFRRRDRKAQISTQEAQGQLGENAQGLLTLKGADTSLSGLIQEENSDRLVIYQSIASKNSSSLQEVQKLYAERLQGDAPAGAFIEKDGSWVQK